MSVSPLFMEPLTTACFGWKRPRGSATCRTAYSCSGWRLAISHDQMPRHSFTTSRRTPSSRPRDQLKTIKVRAPSSWPSIAAKCRRRSCGHIHRKVSSRSRWRRWNMEIPFGAEKGKSQKETRRKFSILTSGTIWVNGIMCLADMRPRWYRDPRTSGWEHPWTRLSWTKPKRSGLVVVINMTGRNERRFLQLLSCKMWQVGRMRAVM